MKSTEVANLNTTPDANEYIVSKLLLSHPSLPDVAIAPDLNKTGNHFELVTGIKDVLDSLIFSSDSTNKQSILTFSENYCEYQQLSAEGCTAFLDLLARYIDYKLALKVVEAEKLNISDHIAAIEFQFDAIKRAQESFFNDAELAALFEDDWLMDQQALARRAIATDVTLSKKERAQLIAQQLEDLPESEKAALKPTLVMNRIAELKSTYADQRFVLMDVEVELGHDAASRLKDTWQQQENFNNRIELVAEEYFSLSHSDKDSQKKLILQEQLLSRHFEGNEIRRAKAILRYYKGSS